MLHENPPTKTKAIVNLPPEGRYGLVGREDDMLGLERAFDEASVVLLTGPPGVGKTELACDFARRIDDSNIQTVRMDSHDFRDATSSAPAEIADRPVEVLFSSFEYGAGLCRLLHEIGTTLNGISFARLSFEEQRRRTVDYFMEIPCLLIWDNFEYVFNYLDVEETQELVDLLRDITGGVSRVLITGRGKEWLERVGIKYVHQELRGLDEAHSRELACLILVKSGEDGKVLGTGYKELISLLQGNPMAMRVVLPHLTEDEPSRLAQAIKEFGERPKGEPEVLNAALDWSFSKFSFRTQSHLPFLANFRPRFLLDVLTFITQEELYETIAGEKLGWGACRTLLREARTCSFVDSISPSIYLLPASVSHFLRRQLESQLTLSQIEAWKQEFVHVYAGLGDYFLENLTSGENSDSTVTGVLAEEANLLHALDLALKREEWENSQRILQPLGQVYKMQERVLELRRLREHLLAKVGAEAHEAEQRGGVELWMYLLGSDVNDAIDRSELSRAEAVCYKLLNYLEASGNSSLLSRKASIGHQLGLIAQSRSQYGEAERWYLTALKINEPLGNETECADGYRQLGQIAQSRRRYEEAEKWHSKALEIRERLEDHAEGAAECLQLGMVFDARLAFAEAQKWYHKARVSCENNGDLAGAAAAYHRLGLMAQAKYDFEEATGWYQKALLAYEELEDGVEGAGDYFQLGLIDLHRYEYQEAELWFQQALAGYERQGNDSSVAKCYHQLGIAAHAQQLFQDAEGRYQRALDIFVKQEDEVSAAGTWGQLGVLADHLGNYPHAVWYVAHTYEIAHAHQLPLIQQAKKHLATLKSKMGTEAFMKCWEQVSDADVLSEIE